MPTTGHALFDTPLGPCGLAWGEPGICRVQLPQASVVHTRERLLRGLSGHAELEPPPAMKQVMTRVAAMLGGAPDDLADVVLDMRGVPEFHQRVYAVARAIAPGATLTYGEVALRLGMPGAARAVGQALGHNPFAPIVPCHRVLAAGARSGGFSSHGGIDTKLRMLMNEGAAIGGPGLFDGH
jgi:methylated-DNA-[protein]-cysteine S-methyltransferase